MRRLFSNACFAIRYKLSNQMTSECNRQLLDSINTILLLPPINKLKIICSLVKIGFIGDENCRCRSINYIRKTGVFECILIVCWNIRWKRANLVYSHNSRRSILLITKAVRGWIYKYGSLHQTLAQIRSIRCNILLRKDIIYYSLIA